MALKMGHASLKYYPLRLGMLQSQTKSIATFPPSTNQLYEEVIHPSEMCRDLLANWLIPKHGEVAASDVSCNDCMF